MTLLIVGASARAAAQSSLHAGLSPVAHDLFGDRDHATERVDPSTYPECFEPILAKAPEGCPWIYTGALENHPDLIDRMAALRPLWGICGEALRACRNPAAVADALASRGLPHAKVSETDAGLPRDGSWLIKPRASAGGRRIRPLDHESLSQKRPVYYQERIEGTPLAAIFCAGSNGCVLFGVTRQMLGRDGEPFSYTGSIGPWPMSDRAREAILIIGETFANAFYLKGIFGVDLILDAHDRPFPVEINPRYTASVEVLEMAVGRSLLAMHRLAFEPGAIVESIDPSVKQSFAGKAILFADRRCTLPMLDAWHPRESRGVADIPAIGATFAPGEPVMSVLARGSSLSSCTRRLDVRLALWRSRLVDSPLRGD